MAYATISELRERLGYADGTNIELAARLTDALDAATVAIDNDTGRTFTVSTSTRTFAVPSPGWVLRVPDLTSVTTLKLDTTDDGTYDTTVTDYELDTLHTTHPGWPYDTIRLGSTTFPTGGRRKRTVEINAVWGWAAVPAAINQACTLKAARIAQRTASALFGAQSFGDVGVMVIPRWDSDYEQLIQPYRLYGVA